MKEKIGNWKKYRNEKTRIPVYLSSFNNHYMDGLSIVPVLLKLEYARVKTSIISTYMWMDCITHIIVVKCLYID